MATETTAPPAPPRARPRIGLMLALTVIAGVSLVGPRIWDWAADPEPEAA